MAVESGLYAVEALLVPDGNELGTMMVAEAQYVRLKWYQRPLYRWIFACSLVGAVVVLVVLVVRPQSTTWPPEANACIFLSVSSLSKCQSTLEFGSYNTDVRTTGSTIPSEIGLLTQLTDLNFYGNRLTSTIPSEIGLLTRLTRFDFSSNSLTSTIPSEIGLLTKLTSLDFSGNDLTFSIPSELGRLTLLDHLLFSYNSLTSSIPSEIGHLTQLTWLGFNDNLLTSSIPSEIGLLTHMTLLDFSNNSLTSTIPSEMGLLVLMADWIIFVDFSNTLLMGTMPSPLCSQLEPTFSRIVIDCGEISCNPGCCFPLFSCLYPCD